MGNALNLHDILLVTKSQRDLFIPILKDAYGISFLSDIQPIPFVYSPTSLKCVLEDTEGKKYVLKMKPAYSLVSKEVSAAFQNLIAEEK